MDTPEQKIERMIAAMKTAIMNTGDKDNIEVTIASLAWLTASMARDSGHVDDYLNAVTTVARKNIEAGDEARRPKTQH